jgi:hypothetical protein
MLLQGHCFCLQAFASQEFLLHVVCSSVLRLAINSAVCMADQSLSHAKAWHLQSA